MKYFLIILIFGALTFMSKAKNIHVNYTVSMADPASHFFDVTIELKDIKGSGKNIELVMPVWRSGRYFVFDFSGGVQEFSATDENGKKLVWSKTDKSTWNIETKNSRN